jgi:hypothetical protein
MKGGVQPGLDLAEVTAEAARFVWLALFNTSKCKRYTT